jgi:homoserine O-acetyltransferase
MRHPPMHPGWIDSPHRRSELGRFALESGEFIDELRLSYVVHGDLADRSKPVILGLCAIGSTHHRLDFLMGANRAFDGARYTMIVIDALGNGLSSSPSNSTTQPGERFPRFTIRDMVRSQKRLLEHLGVEALHAVAGASMGGMQALQWGVSFPAFMSHIVALTPMAKTSPWSQALNAAGRLALATARRNSDGEVDWSTWIAIMHVLAMRTPARFATDVAQSLSVQDWLLHREQWWRKQRCDPLDWTYQSWAYDGHDVGFTPGFAGDTAKALAAITARTLISLPQIDLYNPVEDGIWAAERIPDCGHMMASDADPIAAVRLNEDIARFIS